MCTRKEKWCPLNGGRFPPCLGGHSGDTPALDVKLLIRMTQPWECSLAAWRLCWVGRAGLANQEARLALFIPVFLKKEKYVSGLIEGGQAPPQLGAEAVPGAAHPHTARTAPRGLPRTLDRPWRMCTDTARPGDPTSTAQTGGGDERTQNRKVEPDLSAPPSLRIRCSSLLYSSLQSKYS